MVSNFTKLRLSVLACLFNPPLHRVEFRRSPKKRRFLEVFYEHVDCYRGRRFQGAETQ